MNDSTQSHGPTQVLTDIGQIERIFGYLDDRLGKGRTLLNSQLSTNPLNAEALRNLAGLEAIRPGLAKIREGICEVKACFGIKEANLIQPLQSLVKAEATRLGQLLPTALSPASFPDPARADAWNLNPVPTDRAFFSGATAPQVLQDAQSAIGQVLGDTGHQTPPADQQGSPSSGPQSVEPTESSEPGSPP